MAAKLASTKDIRALFHHKPDISRAQIDALFAKHDFSLSRSITHLESNCTNFSIFLPDRHWQAPYRVIGCRGKGIVNC